MKDKGVDDSCKRNKSMKKKKEKDVERSMKKVTESKKIRKARHTVSPASNTDIDRQAHIDLEFWHGVLPPEDTVRLLKEDQSFLLRKDMSFSGPILLSVRVGDKMVNAIIEERAGGYSVTDREFDSVSALVDYYQVRKVPIRVDGIDATLGQPMRRKPWELRNKMLYIKKELGSGAFGKVYLATLSMPNQKPIEVAAKALVEFDHEALHALWKEARVMQDYDHPNVVRFYGMCNDSMPTYLVMELVRGGSVDNHLDANPRLSLLKRMRIAHEASEGLFYLHQNSCIHRDVAARNLLIDGVTKVADFGLTRKSKKYKIDPEKPLNLRWISPEVFHTTVVDKTTDVYAFGVTLYEIFVSPYEVPYAQWDAEEVYHNVARKGYRLSPPKTAPKTICDLMRECLLEPKLRPTFKIISAFLLAQVRQLAANPDMDKDLRY